MTTKTIDYVGNFTPAMKNYFEEKLTKLNQVSNYSFVRVVLTVLPNKVFNLEVSLDNKVRMTASGEDYYTLTVECIEKLFLQLTKYKKYLDKRYNNEKIPMEILVEESDIQEIVREKTLMVEEMSREEAIMNMEVLGHSFFIFKDIDSQNMMAVIYKRKDSTYGYILCR